MAIELRASILTLAAALTTGCASDPAAAPSASPNAAAASPRTSDGWIALFDGTPASLDNFRNYNGTSLSGGWFIVDGALTRVFEAGDFITRDTFTSFDLRFNFKIAPGGNSGVMYRVIEQPGEPAYHSGPEYQIRDDSVEGFDPAGRQNTGANYDIDPPLVDASRPAGQWNRARIVIDDDRVEHWLNGVKVVEYTIGSDDWTQKVAASKFHEWPEYGVNRTGHIAFQDHESRVAFRDIRIKRLD